MEVFSLFHLYLGMRIDILVTTNAFIDSAICLSLFLIPDQSSVWKTCRLTLVFDVNRTVLLTLSLKTLF